MFDREDGSCQCGGHAMIRLNNKTNRQFYGCDQYPKCKNTEPLNHGNPFHGDLFLSADEMLECWADAMYDGDG